MRRLCFVALFATWGCSRGASPYERCAVLCGVSNACPEEMTCGTDRFCHEAGDTTTCDPPPDGVADGGSDGGFYSFDSAIPPNDAPDAAPTIFCDSGWTLGPYSDEFAGSLPSWAAIYQDPGMEVTIQEGVLRFVLATDGSKYSDFFVDTTFDTRQRVFRTRLLEKPTSSLGEAVLNYWVDENNYIWLGYSQSSIVGGGFMVNGSLQNYDAPGGVANAQWWQVRESGGRVYLEVSSDGTAWTKLGDRATPGFLSNTSPGLSVGTLGQAGSPGNAVFDFFLDCQIP